MGNNGKKVNKTGIHTKRIIIIAVVAVIAAMLGLIAGHSLITFIIGLV